MDTTVPSASPAKEQVWEDYVPPWWVPRGEPVLSAPEASQVMGVADQAMCDLCQRALEDPDLELPQLPQVAQQLLLMLHDDNADLRRAAEIAGRDPALTSEVLRLVNSVAYRGDNQILGLEQAFVRLGRRAVRALVLSSSVKSLAIRTGGAKQTLGEELWRRSIASAVVTASLAPHCDLPEEDLFLVGLLHDIGWLAVLKVTHGFQATSRRKVPREVFDALGTRWHEPLGRRLAEAWELPDPLPEVIGSHHATPGADNPVATYRHLVALADVVCAMLEYAPYVPYDFFGLPCVRELGLAENVETCALLSDWPLLIAERIEPAFTV